MSAVSVRGETGNTCHVNFHLLIKLLLNINHVLSTVKAYVSINATMQGNMQTHHTREMHSCSAVVKKSL